MDCKRARSKKMHVVAGGLTAPPVGRISICLPAGDPGTPAGGVDGSGGGGLGATGSDRRFFGFWDTDAGVCVNSGRGRGVGLRKWCKKTRLM